MKFLTIVLVAIILVSCNRKAEIVELIKKTKNEWYEAEMKRGAYMSAYKYLMGYESMLEFSKKNKSQQSYLDAQTYKKAYENAIKELKGEPIETLKDQKKLHSIADKWEFKADDLKRRIDSLELELKKY